MDQSRQDTAGNNNSQQQNVHLHMHHVCTCQGLYQTYYPPLGYRTPLITYATPQTIARPYLQHYQYTQYNVGNQYGIPMMHLPTCNAAYSITPQQSSDMNFALPPRRERGDIQEDGNETERTQTEPPPGYEIGHVTPPANDLLLTDSGGDAQTYIENFVKFLERGCLTAEQIAYRNRNRPCFRNIQNLCIRTRSEILKPCTTLSNIHSQGIPWVTKDFIYAFIRLTNCWHILRGYWENRDGSALGKVEKELTPEFRASYVKWEKSTVELATQLTRIFYNLDTNLNSVNAASAHLVNNLVPPQVNVSKTTATTTTTSENSMKTKPTNNCNNETNKNMRGILHLPTEAIDQTNQNCKLYESDDNSSVYMKPGSYHVPKKPEGDESVDIGKNIPRVIEFLETAQNVTKGLEAANDKYWAKLRTKATKDESPENELNPETMYNVQDWLSSNSFGEYPEAPTNSTTLIPAFADVYGVSPPQEHEVPVKPAITLLQRDSNQKIGDNKIANGCVEIASRTYRRKIPSYEIKGGGLTKSTKRILENLLDELKTTELAEVIAEYVMESPNLETISKDLDRDLYNYVSEVVKDLRHMINYVTLHFQKFNCSKEKLKLFSLKLETALIVYFPNCDFTDIIGKEGEKVGKVKMKISVFDSDQSEKIKNCSTSYEKSSNNNGPFYL